MPEGKMFRRKSIFTILFATGLSGCLPMEYPNLYKISGSSDPFPWAFSSVFAETYFRKETGQGLYQRLGPAGQHMGGSELCTEDSAARFVNGERPACFFVRLVDRDETCTERNLCVRYLLAPVLRTESMRDTLVKAISAPCQTLSRIEDAPYPDYPYAVSMPLSFSRRVLDCDGPHPVRGYDVQFESDGQHIRFLRTDEPR